MDTERRSHQRFRIANNALAILTPHPIKIGQIINISEGGLAFRYLGDDKIETNYIKLDIFVSEKEKQCNSIAFTTIKDFLVSSYFETTTPVRQLCVKFTGLSAKQKSHLKKFINEDIM